MLNPCSGCERPSGEPVAVAIIHSMSGAGRTVYMCPRCCERSHVIPLAEQPRSSTGAVMHRRRL